MIDKEKIDKVIIDSFQVDDEGVKVVKTFDIKEMESLGIKDLAAFLNGVLDAENKNEFNDSSEDYIKGYKYGETGTF